MPSIERIPVVIDLSHHNVIPVNLEAAADSGIVGVIHKATEGATYKDPKVDAREWMARDAGMLFGLYHFLRAGVSINAQVDNFLEVYKRYGRTDILAALDYEKGQDGKTPNLSEVQTWLMQIEGRLGKRPIIYSGNSLKEALGGQVHSVVNQNNYRLWLAQYGSSYTLPAGWSTPWLWQYTDTGKCPGVDGDCDLNAAYNIDTLAAEWTGSKPGPTPEPKPDLVVEIIAPPGVKIKVTYS